MIENKENIKNFLQVDSFGDLTSTAKKKLTTKNAIPKIVQTIDSNILILSICQTFNPTITE